MDAFRELLACPACAGSLASDWSCRGCGARFGAPDGIPNLRLPGDGRTEAVRRFYERAPFPGYPPRDSLEALHARAERSLFTRLLDRAIPGDARIVEIGCGTGQMCVYLARADRLIIGADLTRASLLLADGAARRFGLERVRFVETDLLRPGLRAGAIDNMRPRGVRRGSAINITIPKSTVIHSPRCRAGLPRTTSSTCGHTRARYWATGRRRCSRARPTTGALKAGWRNWAGCARSGTKAGCSSRSAGASTIERRGPGRRQVVRRAPGSSWRLGSE